MFYIKKILQTHKNYQLLLIKLFIYFILICEYKIYASAGIRIRVNCLEGSYTNHYTTDAYYMYILYL